MRNLFTYVAAVLAVAGLGLLTAPSASAAPAVTAGPKNHGSSDLPWVIGVVVVLAILAGLLFLRLRSAATRRGESGPFRSP